MKYTEDSNLNNFLYCTDFYSKRPSKLIISFGFKANLFIEYFGEKLKTINSTTKVTPTYTGSIMDKKYFCKIEKQEGMYNAIFLSYTHIDHNSENSIITNLNIFFCEEDINIVDTYIKGIEEFIHSEEEIIYKITSTSVNLDNALELKPFELQSNIDFDNIKRYYNENVMKSVEKLLKSINTLSKGLSIIHGQRGVGKTSLLQHIAKTVEKEVIFIPISMVDLTINSPIFREQGIEETLIIIDDSELFNSDIKLSSTFANILQMVDGFNSSEINVHIILAMNIEDEDDIDNDLLEANSLIDVIKIDTLDKNKANRLIKHLNLKGKAEDDTILIDILKSNYTDKDIKIGYE